MLGTTSMAWACLNDTGVARREAEFRSTYAATPMSAVLHSDRIGWALAVVAIVAIVATVAGDRVFANHLRPRWSKIVATVLAAIAPILAATMIPGDWLETHTRLPAPHRAPAVPGGTSLRFAMLHDVLTDRYDRGSQAFHEARLRKRLARIAAAESAGAPHDPAVLDAMDDAAVSFDRLHRHAEGEALMRRKLALLGVTAPDPDAAGGALADLFSADDQLRYARMAQPLDDARRARYRASANLATVLAHAAAPGALKGDPASIAKLAEARRWLLDAIAIHPGAHFGREMWQLVALDWFAAVARDPRLLSRFDMIGDSLDERIGGPAAYRPYRECMRFVPPADEIPTSHRGCARAAIERVGGDGRYDVAIGLLLGRPLPFDEPALALVGMWIYGGGPNPHSALAIAQIAERTEQRYLAVEAYLRALELVDRFHPDEAVRANFAAYCERRIASLASALREAEPRLTVDELRRRFREELARGRAYAALRDEDEARRIAAGEDVDDPALAAALAETHGSIATVPGREEWILIGSDAAEDAVRFVAGGAGCAVIVAIAVLERLRERRARSSSRLEPSTYRV